LLASFAEDLVAGVVESPPLFVEAGEGEFAVLGEMVVAARRAGG
jgi:hypothetical protein